MIDNAETHALLAVAKQAAAIASGLVRSQVPHKLTRKGDRDLASDVDTNVEQLVRDFLHHRTPHIGFLGEEGGGDTDTHGHRWVLDPIDGTINFLHGLPLCAVSLSLLHQATTLIGVIDLPFLGTQYTAALGHGSYADDQQLQVSTTTRLDAALVTIDQYTFGNNGHNTNRTRHDLAGHLASHVQRVRILGSSAIDFAWTAQGRLDACIMLGNKLWDTSAGVLIAREAGAHVLDLHGAEHSTTSTTTVAVTPTIEHQLMTLIHATLQANPTTG